MYQTHGVCCFALLRTIIVNAAFEGCYLSLEYNKGLQVAVRQTNWTTKIVISVTLRGARMTILQIFEYFNAEVNLCTFTLSGYERFHSIESSVTAS